MIYKELKEGAAFHFKAEVEYPDARMRRGPWTKVSGTDFTRDGDDTVYHPQSGNTPVVLLEGLEENYSVPSSERHLIGREF